MSCLLHLIVDRVRRDGPLTMAAYMELALYHPELGYYARRPQRSGRAGDFYTSVDVGPLFGELLAVQFAEMWRLLNPRAAAAPPDRFDLVEAGAGNGRLSRDILEAAAAEDPLFSNAIRLHLVERSRTARAAQADTLGPHRDRLAASGADLPAGVEGVIFANELLDALPAHAVAMTGDGLREIFVAASGDRLIERLGPPSTPALAEYLERAGARLRPGWRAEVNLAALDWVTRAASRLGRGFLVLIDYGHEARELFSAAHARGTLSTYAGHRLDAVPREHRAAPWLAHPGERDITAHVDLTSVVAAAEAGGLDTLGRLDQTYFLLGLGAAERLAADAGRSTAALKRRLAARTLLMPGGLGSTLKVLIFGQGVGRPRLRGLSFGERLT
jgi:SAM-dependent MidA family methyltransferase